MVFAIVQSGLIKMKLFWIFLLSDNKVHHVNK